MEYSNIYEVERPDYQCFIEQLNLNKFNIETVNISKWVIATKIISKNTGTCVCSRVTHIPYVEGIEREPERYYIFSDPELDERQEPKPKLSITLETPQEVQAFANLIKQIKEAH